MSELENIKVVLFDLGNTLIYFYDQWPLVETECNLVLKNALEEEGYKLGDDFLGGFHAYMHQSYQESEQTLIDVAMGTHLKAYLQSMGVEAIPEGAIRRALDAFFGVSQSHWTPRKETIEVLTRLRVEGYRMAIISNAGDEKDVRELMDKAGVTPFMEKLWVSCSEGIRKPHPAIFQKALDYFNILPEEAVMVGDTLAADIAGANGIGMPSVWITHCADRPDNHLHLESIRPNAQIELLPELPLLLRSWQG